MPNMFKIFLAKRGECTFVEKVGFMEDVGMAAGIVMDNNEWDDISNIIMSDDGNGEGLITPSMMISKQDSDKLMEFLKTSPKAD